MKAAIHTLFYSKVFLLYGQIHAHALPSKRRKNNKAETDRQEKRLANHGFIIGKPRGEAQKDFVRDANAKHVLYSKKP
jgi:hypothetical protein